MKIYKLASLFFPTLIILIEFLIRFVTKIESQNFIGPTLATSALSLILPVLEPKNIIIKGINATTNKNDLALIFFTSILLIPLVAAWYLASYYSFHLLESTTSFYIGAAAYFLTLILHAIKGSL